MQATLAELATLVQGTPIGDAKLVLDGAAILRDAQSKDITLLDDAKKMRDLGGCLAAAVIVPRDCNPDMPAIQVDDVHRAFAAVICHFYPRQKTKRVGISPAAVVSSTAKLAGEIDVHPLAAIGEEVEIGAGSTIHSGVQIMAGSKIGRDVTIFPGAVLYENTIVGPRCIIHAGAVLGAHGFGYEFVDGRHKLSAQLGSVVLGADVEIGANSTVDRGTYGPTTIGDGTKIDDQVMVAHNCRIGKHNMLCSQVGVAGSTTTGDYVVMAGQVGVRDHVHIGDRAVLGAMAGITNDVPDDARMIGIPATPEREQKIKLAALAKLPEMRREFKKMRAAVKKLIEQAAEQEPPQEQDENDEGHGRRAVA